MKLIKGILGCALAAGLTTFASTQAQATVIGNELYVPFNLKLVIAVEKNGKITNAKITSSTVLKDAGFSGKVTLAVGPSHTESEFDIYVIQNKGKNSSVIADLSTNDIFNVNPDEFVSAEKGNTESSAGTIEVDYESHFADDSFELSGIYSASETEGNDNNQGKFTLKQNFKVTSLSGEGFFEEISDSEAPVSGSASGNSSGKIQDE